MKHNQKELDEIYVVGKSALFNEDNCDICDNIFPRNYHEHCLKKEMPCLSSSKVGVMSVPDKHAAWCLSQYHVTDVIEGDIARGLKGIDQLSRDLNAIRYDDCFRDGGGGALSNNDGGLAERFFPVTLGGKSINDCSWSPEVTLTFSPPATGLPKKLLPWRVVTPHNKPILNREWLSIDNHIQDNRLFLENNPQLRRDKEASFLQTPYQPELSRLRLERLRLEEEILMEVKRQDELERIRGPQPKWYELKDLRFHYEAKKNNELLRSCNSWQDLFDYRSELKTKSDEFSKKFYPVNKRYDPSSYVSVS